MVCSNVQEVVDWITPGEVVETVEGPVPVNPVTVVEFTGVENGGMTIVCD
jgi:hypothetical protein